MAAEGHPGKPQLNIKVLGSPEVTIDGKNVKINRREQRAGLFFLAANTEPISRAQICDIFWPKDSEQAARKKLREGLSRLRAALIDPDFLIAHDDTISLNPDRVFIDYREYRRIVVPIIGIADMNSTGRLPDWCYNQLRDAMLTYTGPQFLQGMNLPISVEFENWVSYINHGYTLSREKVLQRLADHCISIGNQDECIFWLEWALRTDPMNTDLNYLMVTALKERGNINDAINHLNILESIYQSSQNEKLPMVLQDLREKLRIVPELDERYTRTEEWQGFETDPAPFKGRDKQLQILSNVYHRKGAVLVTGEAGSGKTRLVHEFYSRLKMKPRLLVCKGKFSGDLYPLESLYEGLATAYKSQDLKALPESIRLNLKNHGFDEKSGLNKERIISVELWQTIYGDLYALLLVMSEKRPLLLVVDDAQWCDERLIHFFSYLVDRDFFRQHGMLVLISTQEEKSKPLDKFIDRSVIKQNLETICMDPLSQVEVSQIASNSIGRVLSPEHENWLWLQSGGNPLYLREMLITEPLPTENNRLFESGEKNPIPEKLRSLVNLKMQELSNNANKLLFCAAILGNRFMLRELEEMASLKTEDFVRGMEELQRVCLFGFEINAIPIEYCRFIHDLDRNVVLQSISVARRAQLHLSAVVAMKKTNGESPELANVFAAHYQAAGDKIAAFQAWCEAGRFGRERFLHQKAYESYQTALDIVKDVPDSQKGELLRCLCDDWGDHAYGLTDIETSLMLYNTELQIGEQMKDYLLIGSALSGLGRVADMSGDYESGIETLQRALFYLRRTKNESALIEAYSRLGILYELSDHLVEAKMTFMDALEMIKDDSPERILDAKVNIETQISLVDSMMGFPAEAEAVAQRAVNESLLLGRQSAKVQAYTVLAMAQYFRGKIQKSNQSAKIVYQLSTQLGFIWWNTLLDLIQARNYLAMGNLDESWYFACHAMEGKDVTLVPKLAMLSNTIKGDIFRLLGDYKTAADYYKQSEQSNLVDYESLDQRLRLGMVLFLQGNLDRATQLTRQIVKNAEEQGFGGILIMARVLLELWLTPQNNDVERYEIIKSYLNQLRERGLESDLLNLELMLGYLNNRNREPEQAKAFFENVAQQAHQINHQLIELWGLSNLIKLSNKDKKSKRMYKTQCTSILDELSNHATKKPILTAFRKFRKGIESV